MNSFAYSQSELILSITSFRRAKDAKFKTVRSFGLRTRTHSALPISACMVCVHNRQACKCFISPVASLPLANLLQIYKYQIIKLL